MKFLGLETKVAGQNYDKQLEQKYQALKRFTVHKNNLNSFLAYEGQKLRASHWFEILFL